MGIFGPEYISGWPYLVILSFFPLIGGLTAQTSPILRMTGHQKAEAVISVISMAFNLLVLFLLIRLIGAVGAAVGIVLTEAIREGLKMLLINKKLGIQPYDRRILFPALVGIIATAVILGVRQLALLGSGWQESIMEVLLFIFLFYVFDDI